MAASDALPSALLLLCFIRHPYERDLVRYLEGLIRDMDQKIKKNKERAEAESRPKVLKLEDQKRLDELKARQAGEQLCQEGIAACSFERFWQGAP
jgi:hypothetical protein